MKHNFLINSRTLGTFSLIIFASFVTTFAQEPPRVPPSVKPCLKPYDIKPDLSNIENLHEFIFTDEQKAFVATNHMLIFDGGLANPVSAYLVTPVPFITSDIMLHTYHILVSRTIEDSERVILRPALETFLHKTLNGAKIVYGDSQGDLKAGARKDVVLLAVALTLLGENVAVPPDVQDEVGRTVDTIIKGGALEFDGRRLDTTLFKPRAAYESDPDEPQKNNSTERSREQYFRATIWLQQAGLRMDDTSSLYAAALIARLTMNDSDVMHALSQYNAIVRFLAGEVDGLSLDTVHETAQHAFGKRYEVSKLKPEQLQAFGKDLSMKCNSRILGRLEPAGVTTEKAPKLFFLMEGRYNLTADLFQTILEKTSRMPSGLDYANVVLDSAVARRFSTVEKVDKAKLMAQDLRRRTESDWYKTYDGGLQYAIRSLVGPIPEGFPSFMKTEAWGKKSVNTSLGAWVQFSHDLFLYQKHAAYYRDGGGNWGGFTGYVEPNPEFYSRLACSVSNFTSCFEKVGLFQKLREDVGEKNYQRFVSRKSFNEWESPTLLPMLYSTECHYQGLQELLLSFVEMSRKELESQPFTEDEHDILKRFAGTLRWLTFDVGHAPDEKDKSLICDLATEYSSERCLEVATGKPLVITAIVPRGDKLYLAKGSIFNYFEFQRPITERLTDAQWQNSKRDNHDFWLGRQDMLNGALAELHDPKILEKYLKDKNPKVRLSTARRLIDLGALESLPAILELLSDASVAWEVCNELYRVKEQMGEKGVQTLTDFILSSGDDISAERRLQAVRLINFSFIKTKKDTRMIDFVEKMTSDADERVRETAKSCLKRLQAK